MPLITDRHVTIYQNRMDDIRSDLGRITTLYLQPITIDCIWCLYDTVQKKSSGIAEAGKDWTTHTDYLAGLYDKVCPNCKGDGTIPTEVTKTLKANKKIFKTANEDNSEIGIFQPGTIRLSCNLKDILVDTTDLNGLTWFDKALKVEYDGQDYDVVNVDKGGLRDLYTCLVILKRTNK